MGKQGPCRHCGATSTPLWRNGPPEKSVLCNACGSRWRTKGTLANYFPFHAREPIGLEETIVPKVPKVKIISSKHNEQKVQRRKQDITIQETEHETPFCGQNFQKFFKEDISNRSSSGSALSFSEGCAYFGATDANDLTASQQSVVGEPVVPSRKRACIPRPKPSSVEKLRRDLYSIMCEQQSSNMSGISESDLLYESENLSASVEFGHGGVLLRLPSSKVVEEESEASSFPIDDRPHIANEVHSRSVSDSARTYQEGTRFSDIDMGNNKNPVVEVAQEHVKRDTSTCEKLQILQGRDSPLSGIDLKDVISFETFTRLLSNEEHQLLIKFLSPADTAKTLLSLKSMFCSPQFLENLQIFQQLLLEGIFDPSFSGVETKDYTNLKKLVLSNTEKAQWVEQYKQIKDVKHKHPSVTPIKPPYSRQYQNHSGEKDATTISLKRKCSNTDNSGSEPCLLNTYKGSHLNEKL
ncbi:hypothetical protein J5N97_025199 [Dioscorea zingiberensis]|uniref:GATA transcription factor 26 n=1 Tax=Dioscorea zingiberensis TaxID=325984 RepID=A0A9D5H9L6_9LILI|nr:hypothetical protein J5N97_025199 [Dioscorea zingiberensis]